MSGESHIKSTVKNAAIFASGTILEKAAGFVMLPIYAHLLGREGYGIIGMIDVTVGVLGIFVSYGIGSALYRFYFTKTTDEDRLVFVSTSNFTQHGLSLVICLPAFLLSDPIAKLTFGVDGLQYYMVLAILSFMLETSGTVGKLYLLIQQRSVFVSLLSLARFLLAISLNIYLIVILRLGVLGVLYSGIITAGFFWLFLNGYTLQQTGFHFKKSDITDIIKYSLPLLPGYAAMYIRTNADKIILRTYMGLAEIGIYAMVAKFARLIGMFVHEPFMKTWAPKRMEICESPEGPHTIAKVFTLHLTLMLFAALILALEIPLLIKIMAPSGFWISAAVACFAVLARVAFNSYYHYMFGLLYGKKTSKVSLVLIITAVLSVPLYILFIKAYGVLGAFMGAFAVYMIQCILSHFMARPYYRIPFEWGKILVLCGSCTALFLIIQFLGSYNAQLFHIIGDHTAPGIKTVLEVLSLDQIKGGKLLALVDVKIDYMIEGAMKSILALLFIAVPISLGIFPIAHLIQFLGKLLRYRPFKRKTPRIRNVELRIK